MSLRESGEIVQFLRGDGRLASHRRSDDAEGQRQAADRPGGDAPGAANNEYIKGGDLIKPRLKKIPVELQETVASIKHTLSAIEPYASNDVADWVLVSSFGDKKIKRDQIYEEAVRRFGGCPNHVVYREFGIETDPRRVVVKPSSIDEWCVVQLFKNVSHHKLSLVFQIATPYWPQRRLVKMVTREEFEDNAALFEAVEEMYLIAEGENSHDPNGIEKIFAKLKQTYLCNYARFNGLTRYQTRQTHNVQNLWKEWTGED